MENPYRKDVRALNKKGLFERFGRLLPLAMFVAALSVACSEESGGGVESPGNVILVVGDGMGVAHRDAVRLATVGLEGTLAMDDLTYTGLLLSDSVDPEYFVTDSAAAGTAIATGVKTYNGAVGVNPDGEPVRSVLEDAKRAGKSAGLVTTGTVTDATPAAFGAHVSNRDEQAEIARQYLEESEPDVILGGGEDFWLPEGEPGEHPDDSPEASEDEGSQGTEGDLVERAGGLGYEAVSDGRELGEAEGEKILGLFANQEMYRATEDENATYDLAVPLPEMAEKAVDTLSRNEEGFFLLVEEEGIDSLSADNNAELTLEAGIELEETVEVLKEYAEESRDTLLIVAADHETGGLTLDSVNQLDPNFEQEDAEGSFAVANSDTARFWMNFTTTYHTAAAVPVTAMGPGAEELSGTYENTHLHDVMERAVSQGE